MPTTNGNRKILDLKRWEFCTPCPVTTAAGNFIASSRNYRQQQLFMSSTTVAYIYNPSEDGWIQLPSPALAGTLAAGASGTAAAFSTGTATSSLSATAGSVSSITTNQTLAKDLRGYSIHILSGPNSGSTLPIVSNTVGTNAVISVATQSTAFTNANTFRLVTPTWYVVGSGTLAAGSFRKYDFATNTWTSLSITGLAATIGTDGKLISTPSWIDEGYIPFSTGSVSSATGTTLVDSTKAWTTNQWTNYQVRIRTGAGAGQIRTISSNTGTTLTVPTWTVNPDATSTYSIEGNDDFLYYMGNNAVTMYRYSISANTWTILSPASARAAAPAAGMSGHWVWGVTESDWTNENAILNGRRIYSFRGGAGAVLDYYDIPGNTWVSGVTYSPQTETFTTGTKYAYYGDYIYIQKDATGRFIKYTVPLSEATGYTTTTYPQGAAMIGDTMFDASYHDGTTDIPYIYLLLNTSTILLRQMVI